jgi:hypothetical protein
MADMDDGYTEDPRVQVATKMDEIANAGGRMLLQNAAKFVDGTGLPDNRKAAMLLAIVTTALVRAARLMDVNDKDLVGLIADGLARNPVAKNDRPI